MHNEPHSLDAYLVAHQRAYMWAVRAVVHRSTGGFPQAEAAVESVRHWLREIEWMDARGPPGRFGSTAPSAPGHRDANEGVLLHLATDSVEARLTKAERIVAEAQKAATPRQGYIGFDVALQTIRECTRAVAGEPGHDSAATLRLLDSARGALVLTSDGDAAESVHEAIKLIDDASLIVRPSP
jgi:hypothetical protein